MDMVNGGDTNDRPSKGNRWLFFYSSTTLSRRSKEKDVTIVHETCNINFFEVTILSKESSEEQLKNLHIVEIVKVKWPKRLYNGKSKKKHDSIFYVLPEQAMKFFLA